MIAATLSDKGLSMRLHSTHLGLGIAVRVLSGQACSIRTHSARCPPSQFVVALDGSNSLLVMAPAYGTVSYPGPDDRAAINSAALIMI